MDSRCSIPFNESVKPITNLTKLPNNLPFGLSIVHNTTVCKIFKNKAYEGRSKDATVVEVYKLSL